VLWEDPRVIKDWVIWSIEVQDKHGIQGEDIYSFNIISFSIPFFLRNKRGSSYWLKIFSDVNVSLKSIQIDRLATTTPASAYDQSIFYHFNLLDNQ
jgi:hypothetical protein